jgi:hypothetical protein
MRRITRRIGLFGGPGAFVRAAGAGKGKRLPDAAAPDAEREIPKVDDVASPATPQPQRKSWLSWFGGSKSEKSG